jgi:hypothetical protein
LEQGKAQQLVFLKELLTFLNDMRKAVALTAGRVREKAVGARNAKTNVMTINFEVGDYVLVEVVQR